MSMTIASNAYLSQALNALDATGTPVNLGAFTGICSASPGTPNTGANEFTGGGYARQASTWSSSSAGSAKTNSSALSVTNAGTTAATHFSTFSAVTVGTPGLGGPLTSPVTAATITFAAGSLSLSAS